MVEKIGVEKTRQTIKDADVILFLLDASMPLQPEDFAIYNEIAHKKHIIVQNKIDLLDEAAFEDLPNNWREAPSSAISALIGTNLEQLKQTIWQSVCGESNCNWEVGIVPNLRHKNELEKCKHAVCRGQKALEGALSAEFVVEDLKEALRSLDTLMGERIQGDVLDQIFSRFCIGK